MRKIAVLLLLAALVCLGGCGKTEFVAYDTSDPLFYEQTSPFERLDTVDMDANAVTAEDLAANDLTMINCWATWCGYCIMEMPELTELAAWAEEMNVGVWGLLVESDPLTGAVLAGLSEAERRTAEEILLTTGADYPQLLVSEGMLPYLSDLYSFPTTYFVDSGGRMVGEPVLGAKDLAAWQQLVQERLELLSHE